MANIETINNLGGCIISEIINNNTSTVTTILKDEILILKTFPVTFNDINFIKNYENEIVDYDIEPSIKNITKIFHNDRIKKFHGTVITNYEITQTYPALEKEIKKFSYLPKNSSIETWDSYDKNIKLVAKNQDINWIYNILSHKKESENILYEDEDMIFIYDFKCDQTNINNFYGLIFPKNDRIFSIRDLELKHVKLLSSMRSKIEYFMKLKFNIEPDKLRMYFHYPPSFWYLHIHVNLFDFLIPGINVEYSHMLSTVIENLTIDSDYYKKVNIEIINR
jgi:m7GpppX diphosphatase